MRTKLIAVLVGVAVAASASAAAAQTTIRLGHAQPTKHVFHKGAEKFKEAVEDSSNGEIKVEIFPSGQLGKIRDMIEGLRVGSLQVVVDAPSRLAVYTKLADAFKLPYLVETREQLEKAYASEQGQKLLSDISETAGIRIMSVAWRGARHITSNRKIVEPDDMAGLKIRVPPYDLPVAIFETLGASPTPMSFREVYLGLQQGVIDAQENPMATNWPNRLHEVTKFLILTGHIKDAAGFLASNDFLAGLEDDQRKIVLDSAKVAAKFIGDFNEQQEQSYIENFRKAGVEVITPNQAAFRKKFEGFIENFNKDLAPFAKSIADAK